MLTGINMEIFTGQKLEYDDVAIVRLTWLVLSDCVQVPIEVNLKNGYLQHLSKKALRVQQTLAVNITFSTLFQALEFT